MRDLPAQEIPRLALAPEWVLENSNSFLNDAHTGISLSAMLGGRRGIKRNVFQHWRRNSDDDLSSVVFYRKTLKLLEK